MKELVIGKNDAGQRLDKFLSKAVPALPASLAYKYIRIKRIKVNGRRADFGAKLALGDVVSLYIDNAFFEKTGDPGAYRHITPRLSIVYEDENLLLADKKPGMIVHSDDKEQQNTLIDHIKAYLYRTGQWRPEEENAFTPALANRIDRNTGGIVMAAKNAETLRILNEKIKSREIKKYYLCLIHGRMDPPDGKLASFLFKDARENRVYVGDRWTPGAKTALTLYRTIAVRGGISLVECELVTGRTHQIRAQFAAAGHPLVGDGKYGNTSRQEGDGPRHQALYSYKLTFAFTGDANALSYLAGKSFAVAEIPFAADFR